jgi:hypothetical protein
MLYFEGNFRALSMRMRAWFSLDRQLRWYIAKGYFGKIMCVGICCVDPPSTGTTILVTSRQPQALSTTSTRVSTREWICQLTLLSTLASTPLLTLISTLLSTVAFSVAGGWW